MRPNSLDKGHVQRTAHDIATILAELHEIAYFHHNINLENIFLGRKGVFHTWRCSQQRYEGQAFNGTFSTPRYSTPELL